MTMIQHENLGRVLRYGAMDHEEQSGYITKERDRIARILREAKARAKANKAAHGGLYVPAHGGPSHVGGVPTRHYDMSDEPAAETMGEAYERPRR